MAAGDCFGQAGFEGSEILHGDLHFSAPVGILPGAAGEVLLFGFAGQVLLIDDRERTRSREQEIDGVRCEAGG